VVICALVVTKTEMATYTKKQEHFVRLQPFRRKKDIIIIIITFFVLHENPSGVQTKPCNLKTDNNK
jgi:hypothetical protein